MAITLNELPNEIIYQIILCIPPASVPKVQQVSRQLNDLAQPVLWRYHCRAQYNYWKPEREIHKKYSGSVAKVDWKKIFLERHSTDRAITYHLNSILSSQMSRIEKAQAITAHDYEAKDTLLRHLNVGKEAEDVLARRYVRVMARVQRTSADALRIDFIAIRYSEIYSVLWPSGNGLDSKMGNRSHWREPLLLLICLFCTAQKATLMKYVAWNDILILTTC